MGVDSSLKILEFWLIPILDKAARVFVEGDRSWPCMSEQIRYELPYLRMLDKHRINATESVRPPEPEVAPGSGEFGIQSPGARETLNRILAFEGPCNPTGDNGPSGGVAMFLPVGAGTGAPQLVQGASGSGAGLRIQEIANLNVSSSQIVLREPLSRTAADGGQSGDVAAEGGPRPNPCNGSSEGVVLPDSAASDPVSQLY